MELFLECFTDVYYALIVNVDCGSDVVGFIKILFKAIQEV
eukprot:CAMPEP_0178917152 /NCGR_PEP_ID=MMETSP0786-20121207/13084_1 /TAXON_ID=186022 /ORGANISM="Thalassionema frauenfeldii, Strain CCMP 1798" /LENGTH=39 /DNA_ID= /DNA_START= /DNA_END= /DNA_ORIENTATION=